MEWYGKIAGKSAKELIAEIGETLQPPNSVRFLPYLGGERTPHNDSIIRGAFVGLSHSDDRQSLTRAVLEGVAFALRDNFEALRSAGTEISRVLAVGGGSQSKYWLETIATALDIPVDIPKGGDFGAAFGAARLGLLAASDVDPASVCLPPVIAQTIEPNSALVPAFADTYQSYISTYPSLKGI